MMSTSLILSQRYLGMCVVYVELCVFVVHYMHMHIACIFLQDWRKLSRSDEVWPKERYYHAACCLNYGQECPQLLVSGGFGRENVLLADFWILDIDRELWREVSTCILYSYYPAFVFALLFMS